MCHRLPLTRRCAARAACPQSRRHPPDRGPDAPPDPDVALRLTALARTALRLLEDLEPDQPLDR